MGQNTVNILLGGDHNSEAVTPTLINSINKNTKRSVHVVVLCRGWVREPFHSGKLKVEFIQYNGEIDTPASQQSSANDKLLYLEHLSDWDRCLILGWDQLVVDNIDPLIDTHFEKHQVITGVPYVGTQLRTLWQWKGKKNKLEEIFSEDVLNSSGFDGGTHLVDLDKFRHLGLAKELKRVLKELGGEDNLAMIGLFADKLKPINNEWNLLSEKMHTKAGKILHFNGGNKPWKHNNKKQVWEIFKCDWAYLENNG